MLEGGSLGSKQKIWRPAQRHRHQSKAVWRSSCGITDGLSYLAVDAYCTGAEASISSAMLSNVPFSFLGPRYPLCLVKLQSPHTTPKGVRHLVCRRRQALFDTVGEGSDSNFLSVKDCLPPNAIVTVTRAVGSWREAVQVKMENAPQRLTPDTAICAARGPLSSQQSLLPAANREVSMFRRGL